MSTQADDEDAFYTQAYNYATKKLCATKGYGFYQNPNLFDGLGICKHTKSTCKAEHGDANRVNLSEGATDFSYQYAEWDDQKGKCFESASDWKNFCLDQGLDYHQDPQSGVGYCAPNQDYCSKHDIQYSEFGPVDLTNAWNPETKDSRTDTKLFDRLGYSKPKSMERGEMVLGDCYRTPGQVICEDLTFGTSFCRGINRAGEDIDQMFRGIPYFPPYEGWQEVASRKPGETDLMWLNRIHNMIIKNHSGFSVGDQPAKVTEYYSGTIDNRPNSMLEVTKIKDGLNAGKIEDFKIILGEQNLHDDGLHQDPGSQNWSNSILNRNNRSDQEWYAGLFYAILGGPVHPNSANPRSIFAGTTSYQTWDGPVQINWDNLISGKQRLDNQTLTTIGKFVCDQFSSEFSNRIQTAGLIDCSTGSPIF